MISRLSGRTTQTPLRFLCPLTLFFFLLIFILLEVSTLVQKSPTVDEPSHLLAGYSYLKWGDFRANPIHPPLAKIWAALPLLAFDIKDPRPGRPQWDLINETVLDWPLADVARDMFFVDNAGERLFFYAKLQMIVFGVFLGISVFLCSKKLFGFEAAVAALFIFALDPNILAHSQIIHTDLPFTAFFFIGTCFFAWYLDRASWSNVLLTGLFIGLAAVTKNIALVILPIWLTLGLVKVFSSEPQFVRFATPRMATKPRDKAILLAVVLGLGGAMAYVSIWAVYGFRFDAIPGGQHPLPMQSVLPAQDSSLRPVAQFLSGSRLFPEAWIYGQFFVLKYLRRTAYLLGEVSDGFWLYFPIAFVVKTPVPTLALLGAGLLLLFRGRMDRKVGFFLLIPVLVCFLSAVLSRMNIGLRHILVIYPFLFVFAGGAAAQLWRSGSWIKKYGLMFLALCYVGSCIWTYPHYLAYFNELAGGPKNGYKILIDSNLDWGQDLKGLKRWMDDHGVTHIQFLYFGSVDPEYYGIDATYLPGSWINRDDSPAAENPGAPRYIAMSATLLVMPFDGDGYVKPFRSKVPVATIGHSIFIFKTAENKKM
jgi:dolichyl-phosphate-mannose-protein mannosyltransferase